MLPRFARRWSPLGDAHLIVLAMCCVLGNASAQSYIISKTPQASTGLVFVYLSNEGRLVQTTQFIPEEYRLAGGGKQVVVTINPVVPDTSKARLEAQLADKGIEPGRVGRIIPLNPSKIEVELVSAGGGGVLGTLTLEAKDCIALPQDATFPITIGGFKNALTQAQVNNCELRIKQIYGNVKTADVKFASVAQVRSRLTQALESVTGGAKADLSESGTSYVERQVLQRMVQDASLKSFSLSINASDDMVELVEEKVTAGLKQLISETPPKEKCFIYLADLGRLDVKPAEGELVDLETRTNNATENRFKHYLSDLKKFAMEKGEWEEYRDRVIRHTESSGAGVLKAYIPAEVPIPFEVSADGKHVSDKDRDETTKKTKWEAFRLHMEKVLDVEKSAKTCSEAYWRGRKSRKEEVAKDLKVVAVSNINEVLKAYAESLRFVTGKGTEVLEVAYLPFRMDGLVPHRTAWTEIQRTFAGARQDAMTIYTLGIDGSENPPASKRAGGALQFYPLLNESTAPFRSFVAAREGLTELRLYNYADPAREYNDNKQYVRAGKADFKDFANCGFEAFNFQRLDLEDTGRVIKNLLTVIDTTAVTKLDFVDCELPANWAKTIKLDAKHFPNLRSLQIGRNKIGNTVSCLDDADLQEIAKLPNLTRLTLGRETQLTDKGFAALVDAPSLREFTIVDPQAPKQGFPTQRCLGDMLRANPKLMFTSKIWKNSPATAKDEADIAAIMAALANAGFDRQLTATVNRNR